MSTPATDQFRKALLLLEAPDVVEVGTKRWFDDPTHHAAWCPQGSTITMVDFIDGQDVDVVADAHDLAPFRDECFDVFMSASTWEHLYHPWIACQAALRVLRPGGILWVATHQTFPIHGYPHDYMRWTDEGIRSMFEWGGFDVLCTELQYPCIITPPKEVTRWNKGAEAFLNVAVYARKPARP